MQLYGYEVFPQLVSGKERRLPLIIVRIQPCQDPCFHRPLNCISSQPSHMVDDTEKKLVISDISATLLLHPITRYPLLQLHFL